MSKLQHALEAAAAGIPVFPCQPDARNPHGRLAPRGLHDATTDADTIKAWWEAEPEANIGGRIADAGYCVLDVDHKRGAAPGYSSLEALEAAEGEIDRSYTVDTPTGGLHIYLRAEGLRNSAGKLGKGLDVRASGGYVLLPGSTIEGVPYKVTDGCLAMPDMAADAPSWFVAKVGAAHGGDRAEVREIPDAPEVDVERARQFLRKREPAIEGNGGDAHTFETACRVRDFGLSMEQAVDVLLDEWNDTCDPPWDATDLQEKVRNAYAYSIADPKLKVDPTEAFTRVKPQPDSNKAPKGRHRFAPMSWGDIESMPPPRWLIDGMLPETGLSMLAGTYGAYKSFIALALALDLATGRDTLGVRPQEEELKPRTVLYVAGEGAFGLRQRIAAYCTRFEVQPHEMHHFNLVAASPRLMDYADLGDFVEQCEDIEPALLIIDTLARASVGADENSAGDMGVVMSRLEELKEGWGCNVLAVHHFGADKKGPRGSTTMAAAMDTVLFASREGASVSLSMHKQKDAEEWQRPRHYTAKATETPWGGSLTMHLISSVTSRKDLAQVADQQVDAAIGEKSRAEDDRLTTAAMEVLSATSETLGYGALAAAVADHLEESAAYVKDWLRGAVGKHRLKDVVIALDSRGRPTQFRKQEETEQ